MSSTPQEIVSAALDGDVSTLRALLQAGGDPNAPVSQGFTPLFAAAYAFENGAELVETLLAWGADPSAQTDKGKTALFYAHDPNVAIRLVRASAEPMVRDQSEQTALFAAGSNLNPGVAQVLLDAGFDAGATDAAGNTPLHAALQSPIPEQWLPTPPPPGKLGTPNYRPYVNHLYDLLDVLTVLLDAGAPPNAVNAAEQTPLWIAGTAVLDAPLESYRAWTCIIETLVQAGARLRPDHADDAWLADQMRAIGRDQIHHLITSK